MPQPFRSNHLSNYYCIIVIFLRAIRLYIANMVCIYSFALYVLIKVVLFCRFLLLFEMNVIMPMLSIFCSIFVIP